MRQFVWLECNLHGGNLTEWQSEYYKVSEDEYGYYGEYDYYSITHFPVDAVGTKEPAFQIKAEWIDARRVGHGDCMTDLDVYKIRNLYKCESVTMPPLRLR